MAPKKIQTLVKLQIEAGKATPAPPSARRSVRRRSTSWSSASSSMPAPRTRRWPDSPFPSSSPSMRPQLQLRHQDASGRGSAEEGRRHRQGLRHPQQGKNRQGNGEAGPRDRHPENARPQRSLGRDRDQEHQGHRPLHGHRSRGLAFASQAKLLHYRSSCRGPLPPGFQTRAV